MTALAMHRQPEERAAIEALQAAEGFSEEEILRDKLADHLKEPNITQTQVAKAIGMRIRLGDILADRQVARAAGNSKASAPTLFMNADAIPHKAE